MEKTHGFVGTVHDFRECVAWRLNREGWFENCEICGKLFPTHNPSNVAFLCIDCKTMETRIQELENEGMTRSDAQGVYEAEQRSK